MKNKSVFKYLAVIIIIILLAVISISVYKKNKQISAPLTSNPISDKKLEAAVFSAVNVGLKARYDKNKDQEYPSWDEKVDIEKMDTSLKAATGKWWAYDAWDWIAWQLDNGNWKVILSFDGYSCQELETVPSQYNDFFKDQIYPNLGGERSSEKFCY